MNTIKRYFLERWGYNRVVDELKRTSEALERSRKHSRELQSKLDKAEVDALELERSNQHLLGELRKTQAKLNEYRRKRFYPDEQNNLTRPIQEQRNQKLRRAPRQKHFNEGRKRFE